MISKWKEYYYRLRDPRDNEIRYVGRTFWAEQRQAQHYYPSPSNKTKVGLWEKELKSLGLRAIFEVIKVVEFYENREVSPIIIPEKWPNQIERELVQEHVKLGCNLLNYQYMKPAA